MTCVYAQAYSSLSLFLFQTSLPPSSPHASTTAHIRVGGDGANRPRSPFLPVARSCLLHPFWLGESLGLCWGGKNFKRNRRHRRPAASARALRFSPPSLSLSLFSASKAFLLAYLRHHLPTPRTERLGGGQQRRDLRSG